MRKRTLATQVRKQAKVYPNPGGYAILNEIQASAGKTPNKPSPRRGDHGKHGITLADALANRVGARKRRKM